MKSGHERATRFLDGRSTPRREIVTPEGVALAIEPADYGERLTALLIDLFLWFCTSLVLVMLIILLLLSTRDVAVALSFMVLVSFLVRTFYFAYFELAWQGRTPGKRVVGLRVIDRNGGPLQPGAIVARNLTRDIEVYIPLSLLLQLGAGGVGWSGALLLGWMLLLGALPFVTRDRLRAGDMVGGTMVIALHHRRLASDLVESAVAFAFADQHLKAYGAFELQILEELLRRADGPETRRLQRDVCERICRKIDWPEPVPEADTARFLTDFYTAERAFLEREQLFGKPREDKTAAAG